MGSDSRGRGGGRRPRAALRGGAAPGWDPGARGEHLAGIPERGGAPGIGTAAWKAALPGRGRGAESAERPGPALTCAVSPPSSVRTIGGAATAAGRSTEPPSRPGSLSHSQAGT